jgi:glycosyltransferase involved in cell wall biosynthesis
MKKKTITVSVISDLTTDQRVIRICTTLQEMGFHVRVIARKFSDSLPLGSYAFNATRINCYFRKGVLQYGEFNARLLFRLLFSKTDYLLSNDLDTLVPNYIIGRLRNKKLFYDTHEYYTGVPELKEAPLKKKIWKFFEDRIFPKLKVVYTVNDCVKELYQQEYGNQISVIRNVPVSLKVTPKPRPAHWSGKIVLLMQGTGINRNRGGLELLETMKFLPEEYHLVFIGSGNLWDTLKQKRKEWQLENRVDMISKLPPEELKQYTPLAQLGFSLDGFDDINFLCNLPNKIFDYLHAGVPIVATAIPEVKKILDEYQCGICLAEQEPRLIAAHIVSLMNDEAGYRQLRSNALQAASELCWEHEKVKLLSIYQPFL